MLPHTTEIVLWQQVIGTSLHPPYKVLNQEWHTLLSTSQWRPKCLHSNKALPNSSLSHQLLLLLLSISVIFFTYLPEKFFNQPSFLELFHVERGPKNNNHYTSQPSVSWHSQWRTWGFCWSRVSLAACPCWRQLAHSDKAEDARVLLYSVIYTISMYHILPQEPLWIIGTAFTGWMLPKSHPTERVKALTWLTELWF